MIRTIVCEKDGCSGNKFSIKAHNEYLDLTCEKCKAEYRVEMNYTDYIILSNCSKCNNDTFKVFRDTENNRIYIKCTECGDTPEKVYIDDEGIQISYQAKILNDIKELMILIEGRISSLEGKIVSLESSQEVLEESLAYINRYLVEKN